MPELVHLHDPAYDEIVTEAHAFANHGLGLDTSGRDQITVVPSHDTERAKQSTGKGESIAGGFRKSTGDIVIYADKLDPADTKTGSLIVHELTHSGSLNHAYHPYYNELLAGLGESKYLQWLKDEGRWQPPSAFTLRKAGVELYIPGKYRYHEGPTPNTSQGLVAASSGRLGLSSSNVKPEQVLAASSFGGHEQFAILRQSLDSIQPGLSDEVDNFPENSSGIIQASAVVSEAAARKGLGHL